MDEIVMQAESRTVIGKKVKTLRWAGILPAIIYGHETDPIPISMNMQETVKTLSTVSSSQLVVIEVDGNRNTTLVRDRQFDPVSGALLHVDFLRVSLTERLQTGVRINFTGEAPAVKNLGGVLVTSQDELEVECLPQDLPKRIIVDLSLLENFGDSIYVRDIAAPTNVDILTNPDEMVILVTTPAAEPVEEEEEVEELEEMEEPEVIEKGKKEEEGEEETQEGE